MLMVGSVVAGYRIERELGSGGMGSVYLAAHPTLPRYDALKVLSRELSRDPDFRARFTREADVAASLDHPQIVSVYNRGETDDGQLWIAMQFVDGTDADAALREGTMSPPRAVHIATEVGKALDFAHSHNVVHRDVKPANFLLSGPPGPEERVLLGDFGIARALDDVGLTATGSVMATIAYAAPEVLSGLHFDGRADIYSLGCTLFRLLTGKTPYAGTNGPAATMMAHLQTPPPRVTDVVPGLPAELDRVIAIAMAKDPAQRFGTASELAAAATAALRDPRLRHQTLLAPVPSREVSSYPSPGAGGPVGPWWQTGAPRTMMAPPQGPTALASGVPVAAPQRRRRPAVVGGAVAAVMVLVAATVTAVVWSRDDARPDPAAAPGQARTQPQGPPATDVPASALRSILLTATEIPNNTGENAVVLEQDSAELLDDAATIDNPDCVGAWAPAQREVYTRTATSGVVVQQLRALYRKIWQDSIIQAVVAYPDPDGAGVSLQLQRSQWESCAGITVTITPPGEPAQTWQFGQPTNNAGAFVLEATASSGDAVCQHGLATHGNVLIDIRQCGPPGTADVSALINATADKVPRQQ
ncbi:serine/threonine-protein kinase PknH/PknJ [Mycobacterium sp. IS-1556]|uniref:serine/threonine-protein kinase PknH/PknJ n=1 Tax=Mycobacterium sp. IS-1556 TaxID=1772276 RepID=UPI0009E75FF9|nr:serine/threonine-protein kinase PknH/PknJ [Mycobacterium sp. IS-1556]